MSKTKTVTMEIFRAGKQTDGAGNTQTWTEADLDQIIEATNEMKDSVPAVIGHPKENSPAYAWFEPNELFRKGKKLFARMSDITEEFGEALKRKNFKHRSIALRGNKSLKHVGFFGGAPVAVKGMPDFAYSESEDIQTIEFAEIDVEFAEMDAAFGLRTVGRMFQSMRDFMIGEKGLETADSIISQFSIDDLKQTRITEPKVIETFKETPNEDQKMDYEAAFKLQEIEVTTLKADLEAKTIESGEFSEKLVASEAKNKELQTSINTIESEKKDAEHNAFAEKLVSDGKIDPAEKQSILMTVKALDGQDAQEFKEGDETVKRTPLENYKLSLENKKSSVTPGTAFGEVSEAAASVEAQIKQKAEAIQEKDGGTYGESIKKLQEKEPGLFKASV
jgi:hypothetical protein